MLPPALRPGDTIAVVAPSSPFPMRELWCGLAWLRGRYRISARTSMLTRAGYLAGDDDRRADELSRAFRDPHVKAVVAARGGYGVTRIVDRLPWDELLAHPKWLVGFSDVTALHLEATARGLGSVHAPNVTGLATATPAVRLSLLRALEAPDRVPPWTGLVHVTGPRAPVRGTAAGGNLALVEATAAAGRLTLPAGCVLVLEDVSERPYRIDRMLTALRAGGHLARASALVFGGFERCDPGPDGVLVEEVIAERTRDLGVPVWSGAPFGHGALNMAFVLGRPVYVGDGCLSAGGADAGAGGGAGS